MDIHIDEAPLTSNFGEQREVNSFAKAHQCPIVIYHGASQG